MVGIFFFLHWPRNGAFRDGCGVNVAVRPVNGAERPRSSDYVSGMVGTVSDG